VFIKARREGRTVYIREPYNIVEYDTSDPNRGTFLEGIADPTLDLITGRGTKLNAELLLDEIRVYDHPPYEYSRIGSGL